MTYVTKIYMPDKEKFKAYIDKIYESGWLTNNGPLVQKLEKELEAYLGVKNLLCVSNGTDALQLAYKVLEAPKDAEIITTPFSYVSTTSSIVAEGLNPVYADIDIKTYNLDPKNIEEAITDKTFAITPCHVFGNTCEIGQIDKIADKHGLKTIYDASHTFDSQYKDRNVLSYGDISIISFHATKIFHTIEGGAMVFKDDATYEKAKSMRNYGIDGPDSVSMLGVNSKMNEVQAAMGLCMLEDEGKIKTERKQSYDFYTQELKTYAQLQEINADATHSYSYFPVVFENEKEMQKVREALLKKDIASRQYFHPSLDTLPYLTKKQVMKNSRDIASRILVIPMHSGVEPLVSKTIIEALKRS